MPTVHIEMFSGRDVETKRKMAAAVTEAITSTCNVKPEAVTVIINDMEPENYANAGVLRIDTLNK